MELAERFLTRSLVQELGLYKVPVITEDMLKGYTGIEEYAFSCNSGLESVTIPDGITIIGEGVFSDCYNLVSVTIPNSVRHIGWRAFHRCRGLKSVTIPNSVTSIGIGAFSGCSGLKSITIPNGVTIIGDGAFGDCDGLKSIVIPNSVTSIGMIAFSNCTNLTSVIIGNTEYKPQTVINGKCKAYKGFSADMICRGFQYEEGKTYEFEGKPELCTRGFHACLNLADVFNYYFGKFGKNVVIHEVELEGVSDERNEYDSKVVAKTITIGKRIL